MSKVVLLGSVSLLVVLLIAVGVVLYLQSQKSTEAGTPPATGCTTSTSCPVATPICVIPSGDTKGTCKECGSTSDCGVNKKCTSGKCVTDATSGCATSGTPCPTATPICVVTDADPKGVCRECGSTADCGVNKKCARGKCIDELKCNYNEDCTAAGKTKCFGGTVTTLGTCSECRLSSDCSTGKVCYNGVCTLVADVPPIACTANADCANDPKGQTKCLIPSGNLTGSCKTCAVDGDCPTTAKRCGPDGVCYACLNDGNCQPNFVCQSAGTSTAQCVEKGCASNGDCETGQVCAYPGTTFAKCVEPCTSSSDCSGAGLRNCWGYENSAITQYKFKSGGPNYCVGNGPQKCCWNRSIQRCNASGDCDGGGEGCINSGDVTQQYGRITCNVCETRGEIYEAGNCVKPFTLFDNKDNSGHDQRNSGALSVEECGTKCLSSGDCTHFTYNKGSKTCWEKKPFPNSTFDSFFRHANGVYTKAANFQTAGSDLDRGSAGTSECAAKCDEYGDACYGYMVNKNDPSSCWIKGFQNSSNHVSGNIRKNFA